MILFLNKDIADHLRNLVKKLLKLNKNRQFRLTAEKIITLLVVVSILLDFLFFPNPAFAASMNNDINETEVLEFIYKTRIENTSSNGFPNASSKAVVRTYTTSVTAYNSEVGQCDDSPCITANGFDLCKHGMEDSIAVNNLPFGTKVRIPEYFGDRVFVVRDRMNKRYTDRIDVWMLSKQDARNFGIKTATVEVLE